MIKPAGGWALLLVALSPLVSRADDPPPAIADDPPPSVRVELVGADDGSFVVRLRAELTAAGFTPVPSGATSADACTRGELPGQPLQAFILLDPRGAGAVVCVLAGKTGKLAIRETVSAAAPTVDADATLAIRIVEILRSGMVALDGKGPASRPPATLSGSPILSDAEDPAPSAHPRRPLGLILGLAGGGWNSLADTGRVPAATLAAGWQFGSHATIELNVFGAVRETTITSGADSATLRVFGATMLVGYALDSALRPSLAVGPSLLWIRTRATATASGHYADTDEAFVPATTATARLARRLTGQVAVYAELRIDVAVADVVLRFGDRDVAHLGRPLLGGMVGFEFRPSSASIRD